MELLQLKYFVTVARLEHMTKAAQELRIAQPALSKTISRLEEDLGTPLFERQGRQIRLNAYGKAFLARARAALQLLEEGRREVADLAGLERGRIHLALSNMEQLREPLRLFLEEHPEINFHIVQSSMEDMEQTIEYSEVDFFLTSMPIKHPDIDHLPLLDEEVFLAVPPAHRLASRASVHLSEAAQEPFVGYKEGHPYQKMNNEFCSQAGFIPNVVCEVEDPRTIAELVRSGFGVALIGECKSGEELKLVKLRIEQPQARRTFRIAWLRSRYLSQAARSFRDFLEKYYRLQGIELTPS